MDKAIENLLEAYKAGGKPAAKALFFELTKGLKYFEVIVLKEKAEKAIAAYDRSVGADKA